MGNVVWISWEDHRRSRELAKALGVPLIIKTSPFVKCISHVHLALKTVIEIVNKKPTVLIVQNPSVILAFIAALLKFIFKYYLVVDRHTNFRLGKRIGLNPVYMLYMFLSNFSLRYADLTIVTNDYLKIVVEEKGGRGFVLEDKLPVFGTLSKCSLQGKFNVVFICTYAQDEPYNEVIQAAELLPESTYIYITGKVPSSLKFLNAPNNLVLTGYLSERDYADLLFAADVIMDFTTLEWCLVCGGYEAISLGKPFVTSDTTALRQLFGEAAIYSNHNPSNIVNCIKMAEDMQGLYLEKIAVHRTKFLLKWNSRFHDLQTLLSRVGGIYFD